MKKILLLVHAAQTQPGHLNWLAFRDILRQQFGPEITVEMSALAQLSFVATTGKAWIYDAQQGFDVKDFDLVVFRNIGNHLEPAIAVAAYCRKHHIPYIDSCIPTLGDSKLSCALVRYEHGIPIPSLAYGPNDSLIAIAQEGTLGWPLIVKADNGRKGRDNFLVHSVDSLRRVLDGRSQTKFVIQTFIPNDGDYRILVINNKPRLAILRQAADGSHINNTSRGAVATIVDLAALPKHILDMATQAAILENLTVAGVDVIVDKNSAATYVLEVNPAPQLATGAFPEQKIGHYVAGLREILEEPSSLQPTKTIGHKEWAHITEMPELGKIIAKVDTGAYTNSIHCSYAEEVTDAKGNRKLRYSPFDDRREIYETDTYAKKKVTPSTGIPEERFVVELHIQLGDEILPGEVNLSNRTSMQHPMLIGRKFLKQHGLAVNVAERFSL